ncbi:MAG: ribosome maturation factor RimM [Gammaproteobacteria bacterium]
MTDGDRELQVGRVAGVYGLKGWLRIFSFTDPIENIVGYSAWRLRSEAGDTDVVVSEGRRQGKGIVARLAGIDDRDAAEALIGRDIFIDREQLPATDEGQYYWADLLGLEVESVAGQALGRVDHLLATGANDVLVVTGDERTLVPFVMGTVVKSVDLDGGRIVVDWQID